MFSPVLAEKKSLQSNPDLLILKLHGGEKWGSLVNRCHNFPILSQKREQGVERRADLYGEAAGKIQ